MRFGKTKRRWNTVGGCVRGASHIRKDMPCQDALRVESTKHYLIVGMSDGHGSSACPYSDEGAKAAVDTACDVFSGIFDGKSDPFLTISSNKDIWLPKQIEKKWKSAVAVVHEAHNREDNFSYELYGATLLTLVIADNFAFALQLGDGDILSIEAAGDNDVNVDWIIPPDGNLGPETNSLCQEKCWQYMKTKMIHLPEDYSAPGDGFMFMLSTDGYTNSFYNNEGFKKAGADFYKLWQDEGLNYIAENIDAWLEESSAQGSGDDISLALVVNE